MRSPTSAFCIENQDLAAIKLAESDHAAGTGGRDIWQDIEKEGFSTRIQAALAPTWRALDGNGRRLLAAFNSSVAKYGGKLVDWGYAVRDAALRSHIENARQSKLSVEIGHPTSFPFPIAY